MLPKQPEKAFGNDSVKERTIRRWFAKFRSGDFSLEDEPRSGRHIVNLGRGFEDPGGD